MLRHWRTHDKGMALVPLLLALAFIISCGPAAEPVVVEKEVIKEVIQEVVVEKEVVKLVPVEKVVVREVIREVPVEKEVIKEVIATATPIRTSVSPAVSAATPGGILNTWMNSGTETFDLMQQGRGPAFFHFGSIFNGLIQFDPQDETASRIVPDLAEEWEVSEDATVFTFRLRAGVKFQDGHPLTAEDVKFSFDRTRNPPEGIVSARKGFYTIISSIETPDDLTVAFNLSSPDVAFLSATATPWAAIWPKHIFDQFGDDALNKPGPKRQIGTGPFMWDSYTPGVKTVLRRNPDYFKEGLPYLDGHQVHVIKDLSIAITAFLSGRLDIVQPITDVESEIIRRQLGDKATISSVPRQVAWVLYTNTTKAPWDNKKVRQAINLLIDRDRFVALAPVEGQVGGFIFPSSPFARSAAELQVLPGYGLDMDARIQLAKNLLTEAGYPNGEGLTFRGLGYSGNYRSEAEANILPDILKLANIGIDMQLIDPTRASQLRSAGDFSWFLTGHSMPTGDVSSFIGQYLITDGGRNYGKYSNPLVDELFEKQRSAVNPSERKRLLQEIERLAIEDAAWIPLFWEPSIRTWQRYVKGYTNSPINQAVQDKFEMVWLDK